MLRFDRIRREELRRLAEACLRDETPSAACAHELATRVLELIATRESADGAPYRTDQGGDVPVQTLVALERCEGERDALLRELAALRAARR